MSTRSRKRIYSSFHENTANTEIELDVKSERKTRSKRLKENLDEVNVTLFKTKNRNNYVSYPTDDELHADAGINNDNEGKSTRVLRKNTLREHNINTPTTAQVELFTDTKKLVRTTRRTRKLTENVTEDGQDTDHTNKNPSKFKKPKPKKNKKKKSDTHINMESVPKKKSKNKNRVRQSSSMVVEEVGSEEIFVKNSNKSNISVDSFHSAAGSPEIDNGDIIHISDAPKEFTECDTNIVNRSFENSYNKTLINSVKKPKRSSIKDTTLDTISLTESTDSILFQNMNPFSEGHKPRRTSSIKDISVEKHTEIEPLNNTYTKETKKRKSSIKDTICYRDVSLTSFKTSDTTFEKEMNNSTYDSLNTASKRKSALINATFDKHNVITDQDMNKTFEKRNSFFDSLNKGKKRKSTVDEDDKVTMSSSMINVTDTTYEKDKETNSSTFEITLSERKSVKDSTFEKDTDINNSAFEAVENSSSKRNSIKDTTFEKDTVTNSTCTINNESNSQKSLINYTTFEKDAEQNNSTFASLNNALIERQSPVKDATFDKDSISVGHSVSNATFVTKNKRKLLPKLSNNSDINTTFDKDNKLDTTFDKSNSKSSLISSDNTNITLDKSDMSRISITSDDSRDNIVNTTPVLIESSMDESLICNASKDALKVTEIIPPLTPLKREGTFTKDGPDVIIMSPKVASKRTPTKQMSLPSPGCTSFHVTECNQNEKTVLNVTRSIEKTRRSSLAEVIPRATKVMFCSPVNDPVVVIQQKKKIIKSNLKGSNKSFIFDESVASVGATRKRPAPRGAAAPLGKRRPRTFSANAKLSEPSTPPKKIGTPSKAKVEAKVARTKLPNFATLHQRQFDKMESLDECQERKAKRAKQLLTPTGAINMLERISPKGTVMEPQKTVKESKKPDSPLKSLPTLDSQKTRYTRFGFKLNLDVNPFSIPSKNTDVKPKESKPNGVLTRQGPLPSLAGATSLRRETAKQTVMREKSITEKRNCKRHENRTIIKGVRTNRRFELQMKLRNLE